ncbi:MAG: proline dehydrogenase family protein [Planctomycetota bacterium]|jgi:proline dehydrogenase|nr:proline dehydrogenase family protein [Planctomycetota bacterium]
MFRFLFLALSGSRIGRFLAERMPLASRIPRRFVASTELEETLDQVERLNRLGLKATLDPLGENVTKRPIAEQAIISYSRMLDRIAARNLDCNLSIKMTQCGLDIDRDLCMQGIRKTLDCAQRHNNFVRIDMEGSPYTQTTLDAFWELRQEYDNVGCVIQSYLFRSTEDIQRICESGVAVRLCKGAYQEPPEIAFPEKERVDDHYKQLTEHLLRPLSLQNGTYPAFATHDLDMIQHVRDLTQDIDPKTFEFQMLYGIRRALQVELAQMGFQVRIYVPFGPEWYPYFMRRLAERPANAWFIFKSLFTK